MRTIIAGSRTIVDSACLLTALNHCGWVPTVVVSGGARGADALGEAFARAAGIPIERFLADWDRYGRRAGYLRNEKMAKHAEALIAIWDGKSAGTKHMIDIARREGLKVFVWEVK